MLKKTVEFGILGLFAGLAARWHCSAWSQGQLALGCSWQVLILCCSWCVLDFSFRFSPYVNVVKGHHINLLIRSSNCRLHHPWALLFTHTSPPWHWCSHLYFFFWRGREVVFHVFYYFQYDLWRQLFYYGKPNRPCADGEPSHLSEGMSLQSLRWKPYPLTMDFSLGSWRSRSQFSPCHYSERNSES